MVVSKQVAAQRRAVCDACPNKVSDPADRCSACGCFIAAMVYLQFKSCPLNKW